MGSISNVTFKKLTLLYLIGKFKNTGAYTSYRVQKVLYFGLKNSDFHPFLYRHTRNGQYSRDAREYLDSLVKTGLIVKSGLPEKGDSGAKWKLNNEDADFGLMESFPRFVPRLATSIDESVEKYGYLKSADLVKEAHEDDLLNNTPYGQVLFDEDLPKSVEIDLPEDQCVDLEFTLNDHFVQCADHIIEAIEITDFNLGEVEVIGSFL